MLFSVNTSQKNADIRQYAARFEPRFSAPSLANPYYTDLNIFHQYGYGMAANGGNCTCYAYGRAYEILKKKPNLSTGNAGKWYDYNKSGGYYTFGSEPALGAIAVWKSKSGGAGHVAVVEKIEGDIVTTSESGWNSYYFKTVRRNIKSTNFGASSSYEFRGFIYILDNTVPRVYASLTKTGDYTEVNISLENVKEGCRIIVSSYKNGTLDDTEIITYKGGAERTIFEGNSDTVKVMIWDENTMMEPLIKAVQLN